MQKADIDHRFAFHPANTQEKQDAHQGIREACRALAHAINDAMPDCREKSTAVTKAEEAMFWANAGLARDKADPLAT